jgi:large subunit ribosomal protein L9
MKHFLQIQKRFYTCIVQRYKQPKLVRKEIDPRKQRVKGDHFHMKLVECTHVQKAGECEIILTDFVEGIGRKGELVKVHRKVANTDLIPSGLAVYPTEEYIEMYKTDRESAQSQPKVSPYSAQTKEELMKITLDIPMNMSNDWIIKEDFIRIALRYQVS